MSQWINSDAFRNDYEKRILRSLDERQLRRDGLRETPKRNLRRFQRLHQDMLKPETVA